jgi:hypothetical protein
MATDSGDSENPVTAAPAEREQKAPRTPEISRSVVNAMMLKLAKWPLKAPPPNALLELIRDLSKQRRIGFLDHSQERLSERGFDVFDVYQTLENGHFAEDIEAGANEGEWKVKVVDTPEGTSRKMGVVTIVVKDKRLLIKTVEWEDR